MQAADTYKNMVDGSAAGLSQMLKGILADAHYLSASQDFLNTAANLAATDFFDRQNNEARKTLISLNQAIGYTPAIESLSTIAAITGKLDLTLFTDAALKPWLECWRTGDDEDFEYKSVAMLIIRDYEQHGEIDPEILPKDEIVHKKVFAYIEPIFLC